MAYINQTKNHSDLTMSMVRGILVALILTLVLIFTGIGAYVISYNLVRPRIVCEVSRCNCANRGKEYLKAPVDTSCTICVREGCP